MPKLPSSRAAIVTWIVVLILGLALFIGHSADMKTPAYWVGLIAPAFFLGALRAASDAFVRLDRGDAFGPAVVGTLKEIGYCLMLGAFAAAVVEPSLIFLIGNGFSVMRGVSFDLSVVNVTLILIGVVLIALAREGQKLQSKLDEFV